MVKYCTDLNQIKINTRILKKRCGYCKTGKEVYDEHALAAKDFCIDAYYAAYPYFLALLYDAKFNPNLYDKGLIISCPAADNPSFIKIGFEFKKFRIIINFLEKVLRQLGLPKDAIDKRMKLEVAVASGQCSLLTKGNSFIVKIPDIQELCPASFFSIYPMLHLYYRNNLLVPNDTKGYKASFICPDPKTNIGYDANFCLKRPCNLIPDLSKFKVLALDNAKCKIECPNTKEMALDMMLPPGICPFVFNIAIPYIITFQDGGYFKWRKDINTVEAQCPNRCDTVEFEIRKGAKDLKRISLGIKRVRGSCPYGHKAGQAWDMDFSKLICLHLYVRFFPYLLLLENEPDKEKYKSGINISCPFQKSGRYLLMRSE